MCGRYYLDRLNKELLDQFGIFVREEWEPFDFRGPRYNVMPGLDIPVFRPADLQGAREAVMMRWGLVLPWAKSANDYPRPSNSRDDKLGSPMYASALKHRRCVIPISGFFEWPIFANGEKTKVMIRRRDDKPIAVAGLWSRYEGGPEPIESTTMVTTGPNEYTAQVHDRTIVILEDDSAIDRWLDPAIDEPAKLMPLVKACDRDLLVAFPVQYESAESPDCIVPTGEAVELNDPRTKIQEPKDRTKKAARKKAAPKKATAKKAAPKKPPGETLF